MAFALRDGARLSLVPPEGGHTHGAADFASCCGPHGCSPIRAFDAGLRPDPFPDRAASLLPGSLVTTRTGLPPAGDDEHTKLVYVTTYVILLGFWAHSHWLLNFGEQRLRVEGLYYAT